MPTSFIVPIWTLKLVESRPLSEKRITEILNSPAIFNDSIFVNDKGEIVDGYHRLEARRRAGIFNVEVIGVTQ